MLSLIRPDSRPDFIVKSRRYLDELRAVSASGVTIDSSHFRRRALWSDAKHKATLVGAFAKCAWCERIRESKRELNVEHYRPKAAITHWIGSPSYVSDAPPKEARISDGYWWLAFEWSNYALACDACNQTWKRNLFPVAEPRVPYGEGMEHHEAPLLLDPMSEFDAGDHFRWDSYGYMHPRSPKGEATIITRGLNRAPLVDARRKTTHNLQAELERFRRAAQMRAHDMADRHVRSVRALCAPESEFAGMNRWWLRETMRWGWSDLA